jgi:hypothetical protein
LHQSSFVSGSSFCWWGWSILECVACAMDQ